jgi:hypothetical protein
MSPPLMGKGVARNVTDIVALSSFEDTTTPPMLQPTQSQSSLISSNNDTFTVTATTTATATTTSTATATTTGSIHIMIAP